MEKIQDCALLHSSTCFLLAFIYVVSLQELTLVADRVTIPKIGICNITLHFNLSEKT